MRALLAQLLHSNPWPSTALDACHYFLLSTCNTGRLLANVSAACAAHPLCDHELLPPSLCLQATAMKLGSEREELESRVAAARDRMEQGLPPTDDTEREWWVAARMAARMASRVQTHVQTA